MAARLFLLAPALALMLGGCLAKTAIGVVTAPIRVASQAADWATTSQDEADRARGREIRARESQVGELERDYEKFARRCDEGNDAACRDAVTVRRQIDALLPGLPREAPSER